MPNLMTLAAALSSLAGVSPPASVALLLLAFSLFLFPVSQVRRLYRAVITLYDAQGKKQLSIADKTLEGYDAKVFEKLKKVYLFNRIDNANHPEAYAQSADSILRFWKTIKAKKVKGSSVECVGRKN